MKLRTFTVFLWGFLIAAAAVAGEEKETKIKIAVATDGDDPEIFEWHSADSGVDLSKLEVGESKTITNENGKEVTFTRTEEGFDIAVDGKDIEVMQMHGGGEIDVDVEMLHAGDGKVLIHKIHEESEDGDLVIKKTKNVRIIKSDDDAGVTIISSDAIDEKTRERLKEVLKDAGKDGEILFLDGSELSGGETVHGKHEVRVIRKEADATN
jgi:hypothetical protein